MSYDYNYGSVQVRSTLPLPQLSLADENSQSALSLTFYERAASALIDAGDAPERRVDGGVYLLYDDQVEVVVDAAMHEITCTYDPGTSLGDLEHHLLDDVLPRVLAERGFASVHGSGIAPHGQLVLFLAESGSGKSTLAASFGEHGIPVLSDDCYMVDTTGPSVLATPGYSGLRLHQDSLDGVFTSTNLDSSPVGSTNSKHRVRGIARNAEALPVSAVFVLGDTGYQGPPTITPLTARDATLEIVRHSFRLSTTVIPFSHTLDQAEAFVRRSTMLRLDYERRYEQLPQVRETVLSFRDELRASSPPVS